jgi:hypothetical protein
VNRIPGRLKKSLGRRALTLRALAKPVAGERSRTVAETLFAELRSQVGPCIICFQSADLHQKTVGCAKTQRKSHVSQLIEPQIQSIEGSGIDSTLSWHIRGTLRVGLAAARSLWSKN